MSVPGRPAVERFTNGQSIGIGSLPHLNADAAAAFSIGEFDIATIPTLPMRSPAEGMIAQAIAGLPGVSLGQYGSFAVDPVRLTGVTSIETDLTTDAFAGLRIFLDLARNVGVDGLPVKWQFVGPVTLGVALQRAGLRDTQAFTIAVDAVRHHVAQISAAVSNALPSSVQLLLLDEPTEGLAPALVQQVYDLVTTLAGEGIAVLLVSPSPAQAIRCADRLTVLTSGRAVLRSDGDQARADPTALNAALELAPAKG